MLLVLEVVEAFVDQGIPFAAEEDCIPWVVVHTIHNLRAVLDKDYRFVVVVVATVSDKQVILDIQQ